MSGASVFVSLRDRGVSHGHCDLAQRAVGAQERWSDRKGQIDSTSLVLLTWGRNKDAVHFVLGGGLH